ncbi:uncharacterized protein F4807DRAFT_435074 [Annulohypoxylon truncatum]|uniref:uncharacterized protein n=1 Tax=Annulohypoxylon truncatum TaxID=327061 RepID=UPI00200815B2|nr:uncharacterized protein F4807DRAFT_435074 [Annulohypoxylon truncatum]KAI1207268.1 hypothetical protein F4807DRAFT_435074 [Annulohypoxylon truncatum]
MAPLNQTPGQDFAAVLSAPALQPPDGVTANFDNPPNHNVYAYVASIISMSFVAVFVFLRVYARVFYLKKVHIADFIGLAAFGTYLGFMHAIFTILFSTGYFVHQWDMRVKDLIAFDKMYFQGYMFYCATVLTIKSAIIIEWTFIFVPQHTRNAFYWICQVLLWFNILFYIAMMILPNVACHPHERLWNPLIPGTCINTSISSTLVACFNFATDIVLLVLPQKVIWGLQMSIKRKLGISLIFLIGILASISAGFKVAASVPYYSSRDTTYTFAALALWSLAEITCGILIFCMPSIPKTISSIQLAKLASSLKSWAGTSMEKLKRSRSGSASQVSWRGIKSRSSKSSLHQRKGAYQQMDGRAPPLPSSVSETTRNKADSSIKQDPLGTDSNAAAIVRTTQFMADETYGLNIENDEYNRQHPWVEKRG